MKLSQEYEDKLKERTIETKLDLQKKLKEEID